MLWGLFVDANPDSSSCSRAFNETGWGIRWGMFRVGLETQRRAPSPADLMAGVVKDQRLTRINLFGGWLTSFCFETRTWDWAALTRKASPQRVCANSPRHSNSAVTQGDEDDWVMGRLSASPPSPWWAVSFWQKRCDYGLRCPTRRD